MTLKMALLACSVGIVCAATPPVPNWGGNAAHFGFSVEATFTDPADAGPGPNSVWNFTYYYDWKLKAERYDHQKGQHIDVCKVVNIVDEPCTALSASDGKFYIFSASSCCQCVASWAPLTMLPDWISRNNGTYIGRSTQEGVEADGWLVYGASDNHYYTTTDSEQKMLKFSEHKNGKLKQWDVFHHSQETPPASKFSPPPNCNTRCPKSSGGCE
jgi:hypothetical protein